MTEAFDFEGDRNRTYNLWIKSPLLYQLSYAPGPCSLDSILLVPIPDLLIPTNFLLSTRTISSCLYDSSEGG